MNRDSLFRAMTLGGTLLLFGAWAYSSMRIFLGNSWLSPVGEVNFVELYRNVQFWSWSTLAVLFYVLFLADLKSPFKLRKLSRRVSEESRKNRRAILLSLIGGFAVALPALAITLFAVIAVFPADSGPTVVVSPSGQGLPPAYLLAVDGSARFLTPPGSGEGEFLKSVLARDSEAIVRSLGLMEDVHWYFAFAGDRNSLVPRDLSFMPSSGGLREAVAEYLTRPGSTSREPDTMGFLEEIVSRLRLAAGSYSHVTLIVMSDFRQPQGSFAGVEAEARVRLLMEEIQRIGNVHIVGVNLDSDEQRAGADLSSLLESYARPGLWRKVSLADFVGQSENVQRSLFIQNAYREEVHSEPLYLKYRAVPWEPISAKLQLPVDGAYGRVLLGLRSLARGGGSSSCVSLALKTTEGRSIILAEPAFTELRRHKSADGSLRFYLQGRPDGLRSVECDLLVAVPARGLVHSIRVAPVLVADESHVEFLRLFLGFMGKVLFLLAAGAVGVGDGFLLMRGRASEFLRRQSRKFRRRSTQQGAGKGL
jgi:hypothetical protein